MKEVMEAFLGLFFFMIIITGSMSVITAAIDAKNADAAKTGYIAEIENSNFSSTVLESIFEQAESEGYVVSMRVYHMQNSGLQSPPTDVNSSADIPNTSDVYMVRLQLTFDYKFHFLNSVTRHTLIGYAR